MGLENSGEVGAWILIAIVVIGAALSIVLGIVKLWVMIRPKTPHLEFYATKDEVSKIEQLTKEEVTRIEQSVEKLREKMDARLTAMSVAGRESREKIHNSVRSLEAEVKGILVKDEEQSRQLDRLDEKMDRLLLMKQT